MWKLIQEEGTLIRDALLTRWLYVLSAGFLSLSLLGQIPWTVAIPLALALALLTVVDVRHFVLPDVLTLPGIIAGLVVAPWLLELDRANALAGALVGGGLFTLLTLVFYWVRKKHGMGFGDVKLLALIGAWTGLSGLLPAVLVASFSALFFLPIRKWLWGHSVQAPVPFGPFLIAGFWFSLLYQQIFWAWLWRLHA